jgi:hypothetical protein
LDVCLFANTGGTDAPTVVAEPGEKSGDQYTTKLLTTTAPLTRSVGSVTVPYVTIEMGGEDLPN